MAYCLSGICVQCSGIGCSLVLLSSILTSSLLRIQLFPIERVPPSTPLWTERQCDVTRAIFSILHHEEDLRAIFSDYP
jgi:hypothetical protein